MLLLVPNSKMLKLLFDREQCGIGLLRKWSYMFSTQWLYCGWLRANAGDTKQHLLGVRCLKFGSQPLDIGELDMHSFKIIFEDKRGLNVSKSSFQQ